ncbi:MAG: electron transfer flavoprotein subunit beta/FixA family protein, partial [Actinomycetia bacterium]|nr:electron transfer flavoprotein subunit beta/FixA family protein [Actinomycetes bacterium]
ETNTLVREGIEKIINPFDTYALEEGIRIKERVGESSVSVISMGPPQTEDALREAISLGADEAYLLSDRKFAGADTWATAVTLAAFINKLNEYDLIICGKQTLDGDTGQVGPSLAEKLDIPHVTYVKKIEEIGEKVITVQRMIEEGYEIVQSELPILITVVKEINEPRLPRLKGMLMAKKKEIKRIELKDLDLKENEVGLNGSPTKVIKIFSPEKKGEIIMLNGEVEDVVKKLIKKMRDDKLL